MDYREKIGKHQKSKERAKRLSYILSRTRLILHYVLISTGRNRGARSKRFGMSRLAPPTRNAYLQFHGRGGAFRGSRSH